MSEYPNWTNMNYKEREEEIFEKPENLERYWKLKEARLDALMDLIDEILYCKQTTPAEKSDKLWEIKREHSFWNVHHWSIEAKQLQQAISNVRYLKQINSRGLEPKVRK